MSEDVFIHPKPYDNWTLGEDGKWIAPVSYPEDGEPYCWDESLQSWVLCYN